MLGEHCKSCIYFKDTERGSLGVCRRFPAHHNKSREDWCGEYEPENLFGDYEPEMLKLPVVDMKRKPGRPKKEVQNVQAS